ncbi:MAG: hypothetical protein QOD65_2647 [Gaiellales bacterium]|jgi:hypothetical protein|nr:hypothetical protein [Gaiellales bacterium]MDX6598806.1 hypothetical protein [Gaiellales bacterium]
MADEEDTKDDAPLSDIENPLVDDDDDDAKGDEDDGNGWIAPVP